MHIIYLGSKCQLALAQTSFGILLQVRARSNPLHGRATKLHLQQPCESTQKCPGRADIPTISRLVGRGKIGVYWAHTTTVSMNSSAASNNAVQQMPPASADLATTWAFLEKGSNHIMIKPTEAGISKTKLMGPVHGSRILLHLIQMDARRS